MTYRELLASNDDFRRLWLGQVVSEIGDWLNNISVLALTLELAGPGHQGRAVALYAIARHLPLFLFGPIAGVVTDRVDRRRVMMAADFTRALLALGFLLAQTYAALPVIYLVGASLFSVSAFFNAAKRATIPNLVHNTDELLSANSLSASTTATTIAIGSALGGLVATFIGRNVVFIANALTFLASAELIRRIRAATQQRQAASVTASPRPVVVPASMLPVSGRRRVAASLKGAAVDFREGLKYVRGDEVLAAVFIVAAGWGLGNGAARAVYSLFGARLGEASAAEWVARPTDFGISVLFVAMGVGGALGAPLARRFNQSSGEGLGARMGRSLTLDGLGLTLLGLMPNLWGAAAVLVAREMNFAIWWTAQQTMLMKRTDDRFGGRVFASYETLTTLMMVGAMLVAGVAADRLGVSAVAFGGGLVVTLSGLSWFVLRRRAKTTEAERRASTLEEERGSGVEDFRA